MWYLSLFLGFLALVTIIIIAFNGINLTGLLMLVLFIGGAYYFYKKQVEVDSDGSEAIRFEANKKAKTIAKTGILIIITFNIVESCTSNEPSRGINETNNGIDKQTEEFIKWQVESGEWDK